MNTTKLEYIKNHPKSYLAKSLLDNNWPDNTQIMIIGGCDAPNNPQSNLYKALQVSKLKKYVVGGKRQRQTEGYWIAIA